MPRTPRENDRIDDEAESAMTGVAIVLGIILVAGGVFVCAWSAWVLWGWFVVPVFTLPHPSIMHFAGFSLVATAIIGRRGSTKKGKAALWSLFESGYINPTLAVGIGWVVKLFL